MYTTPTTSARLRQHASHFRAELAERSLLPGDGAIFGETRLGNWPGRTASG